MRATHSHPSLQRGAAWVCLLALLCSWSWFRVLAVTGVALLDGSHRVQLSAPEGRWRLLLQHPGGTSGPDSAFKRSLKHSHPLGASLLMVLAESSETHRDHVLALGEASERPAALSAATGIAPLVISELAPPQALPFRMALSDGVSRAIPPRGPPQPANSVVQTRSTVLLI